MGKFSYTEGRTLKKENTMIFSHLILINLLLMRSKTLRIMRLKKQIKMEDLIGQRLTKREISLDFYPIIKLVSRLNVCMCLEV
jgi:hypothetical protein